MQRAKAGQQSIGERLEAICGQRTFTCQQRRKRLPFNIVHDRVDRALGANRSMQRDDAGMPERLRVTGIL